tara:strand:- start:117 stop:407 length:291 start_codon:yes stop_codon:yes gene_type:complete
MSFTIIYTYYKEDPLVDWYPEPADVTNLINQYKADGKITYHNEEEVDSLTKRYTITFDNQPRSLELGDESVIQAFKSGQTVHNTNNQITVTKTYGQ